MSAPEPSNKHQTSSTNSSVRRSSSTTEEELNADFSELLHSLSLGVQIWELERANDPASLRLLAMNSVAERLAEGTSDQLVGNYIGVCCPLLVRHGIADRLAAALSDGQPFSLTLEAVESADATPIPTNYLLRGFPLSSHRVGVIVEDISDRRFAEQAQLEGQARKSAILDYALDGIVTIDEDGRVFEWNPAAEKMFGYSRQQVLGKRLAKVILRPDDISEFHGDMERYLQEGTSRWFGRRVETVARRQDGSEFPVELSVTRVPRKGAPLLTGFIRDITERKEFEARIRKNESTLLEAQRIGRIGSWEVDLQENTILWSDETFRIFGQRPDQFQPTRETFYTAVHPLDRDKVRHAVELAESEGIPYRVEHRIILPDGSQRFVHERAEVVHDAEGRSRRLIGAVQDITDLKKAEEALRASQILYSSLVESLPLNIFRKDRSHCFTFANTRFCEALGKKIEDIIGRTDHDFFPPDLATQYQHDDLKVMQSGTTLESIEECVFPALGHRYIQTIKTPWLSASGKVIGVQGMFWDVTERMEMEKALQQREEHFRSLIENSSDVITIINSQGVFGYISESIQRILAYRPEELIGRSVADFIHPDDTEAVMVGLQRALETDRTPVPVQFRFRHANMSWRHFEAIGKSYADTDNRSTIVVNARDISERHQLENQLRQAQKMESIGQLAGGVAHDFNNILTVIQGHASLLQSSESLQEAQLSSVRQIAQATDRAANLTRQLLTFSRKQVMQPKHLDLNEIVSSMSRMLQRLLGEDVSLHVHFSPELPAIRADQGMVEQVLLNLAVNSRDAMPQGGQLIINTSAQEITSAYVAQHPEASSGLFVRLSVSDTGTGIPTDLLPHVFEPFFTTKDVGKGTGLGLATVYGIVRQHQGWITVDSEAERGTIFEIFFPASSGRAETAKQDDSSEPKGGPETILIVEDEKPLRTMVKSILKRYGYRVLEADSGQTAIKVWQDHQSDIDLVLTDMVMPDGMTGRELGNRIRSDKPTMQIIYSSGYSREIVGEDFFLQPGLHFLQKPYHPKELVTMVRACLDGQPTASPEPSNDEG